MPQYKFVTNGSFIEFYDDAMFVESLPTNYTGFTWRYDTTPGISFSFNSHEYHTDNIADIIFNDVPLASQVGFKTALGVLFPHYAVSGVATIYTQDGTLNDNRIVDLDGKRLLIRDGDRQLLHIDPLEGIGEIKGFNAAGGGNEAEVLGTATANEVTARIKADFNNGVKTAIIEATAEAARSGLRYSADTHKFQNVQEFADNAAALAGDLEAGMIYRTGDNLKVVH